MIRLKRFCTLLLAAFAVSFGSSARADGFLFDFGGDATITASGPAGPATAWNNVTGIGTDDFGFLEALLTTEGNPTTITFQMVSRFNGANESGTTTAPIYPSTATRDSLFGNTELFSNLENITPIFDLSGLNPAATYSITFYASRLGVADNRETRYTVTGATEAIVDLDAANNQTNTVTVPAMAPDGSGIVRIALTPGPNNNNANHFTYLGVLEIEASTGETILIDFGAGGSPTDFAEPTPGPTWINITPAIGGANDGFLGALTTTNGTPTPANFQMIARFNGANGNGTTASTNFPVTAAQDSLFGNTEAFSGLSNILPQFKLTGLNPSYVYHFTFFGSRTGVSDNRETRYAVTGANSGEALLNTANNVNDTVAVSAIRPTASGEITVALTPGPNNNNANHFTYLGVMKVDFEPVRTPRILIDFGGGNTTELGGDDPDNAWNNVTTAVGSTDDGSLPNLVRTDGSPTPITLQMLSRFNGANENGTQLSGIYPLDATRDSLFGNTELFSGLENVTPTFKLTGLNPATAYTLKFYASRMGVADNRETRYTVTGASESIADLNVANNELESATIADALPNAAGEITIALSEGPNNDNGNSFTYLGLLQIDWTGSSEPGEAPELSAPAYANGSFSFTLSGTSGATYGIQRTENFGTWQDVQSVTLNSASQQVQVAAPADKGFYRAIVQ